MEDEEPRDDRVTREVAAEEEEGRVAADERDRLDDRERDPDARSRDEIVRERIAEEAVEDREDEKGRAHDPVELAGLAECSGEEDAEHVDDDRPYEDVRRPVVHLAHEQTAPHGKAQVQCRGERL